MTRTRPVPAPADYARDRAQWATLIAQTHAAVAGGKEPLDRLASAALRARDVLVPLTPYPRSLVGSAFAGMVFAYARQTDAALRAQLAPVVLASAGMVDEMLGERPESMAAIADMPEAVIGAPVRLPYRED